MNTIILPFDKDSADEVLRGRRKMLPWIKNFKRFVDVIVVALITPSGLMAIGFVKVEAKSFISKYTASGKITAVDGSLPRRYWYDFEDCPKVCLFRLSDRFVLEKPIPATELTGGRSVGSGIYVDNLDLSGCRLLDKGVM